MCGEQSFSLAEISSDFITLRSAADVPLGPAELIIRYDDRPEVHRHIEILGPMQGNPLRIAIRRSYPKSSRLAAVEGSDSMASPLFGSMSLNLRKDLGSQT
ncbi:MAG: hypothetical protein R3C59_08000 [Planctomycetaceae bacterium]